MTLDPAMVTPDEDACARDDVRNLTAETLFVEAGAGSGKTTALVDRVVSLVRSGTELASIAAITFTEKAAAELKDRLRERLEEAAAEPGPAAEQRERCLAALEQIDGAAVQTLHGFAQRILSQSPTEAGLPPGFELADEIQAAINFDAHWARFLDDLLGQETSPLPIERALDLGFDIGRLKDVARAFHDHWDRLRGDVPLFESLGSKGIDVSHLVGLLDEVVAALRICGGCEDQLERHIRTHIEGYAPRLRAQTSDDGRIAVLTDGTKIAITGRTNNRLGNKDHWRGPTKDEVLAAIAAAEAERMRILGEARMAALGPILEAVRAETLAYAEQRRLDGRLEFHDLLIRARDLVASDPAVRQRLGRQYQRLLIDEFQDTDPIQLEIATLIASPEGERPWDTRPIEPGRLFVVGDPKQSIYRFRNADIELYGEVAKRFGAGIRHLTRNYRSVPPIVDWVNEVVGTLFMGGGEAQAPYVPLAATRPPLSKSGAPVRFIGGPHQDESTRDMRKAESPEIADAIRAIRSEAWPVSDGDAPKGVRSASLSDIALLLPARTTLDGIERALEDAGIPFRVESQSLLYATQEVRDLINILGAIDDPTDEVAVVAALRSPAFACSDPALEAFVRARGRWDYTSPLPEPSPTISPVLEAMGALRLLHEERWHHAVNEFVELVTRERRVFEVAFAHHNPRQTWQRLRFVLERARAYSDAGGATLRGFVAWLRQQSDTDARVAESIVPEMDDDAVRIMTVHAAKGLEFPIVFLAGLNTVPYQRMPAVIWDSAGRPQVRAGYANTGWDTAGYAQAYQREGRLDALEKDRLLYVAATRARDYLVLSLHHKFSTRENQFSYAQKLYDLCISRDMEPWRPEWVEQQHFPETPDGRAPHTAEQRNAWIEKRRGAFAAVRRAPVFAATALKPGPDEKPEQSADDAPWRRGRAGTSIGRAVHAVLQTVPLEGGNGIEETARAQATAEGVAGREVEVCQLVRAALAAPAVREAVASRRYWREVYVGAPVSGSASGAGIEGFIDLLFEGEDGLVVVDYKTDAVRDQDEVDAAVHRYRTQAGAYALALAELGLPAVARCVFVFLRKDGTVVESELRDVPALIVETRARLTELADATI